MCYDMSFAQKDTKTLILTRVADIGQAASIPQFQKILEFGEYPLYTEAI